MNASTPVTRELDEKGIEYRLFRHAGEVRSLEQAARERGQRPEQVVRSILFRLTEGQHVMVLVAGPQQISWPALRRYLGISRMTLASPEEVRELTGYEVGAVAPFGLPEPMRVLVDESVLAEAEVSIGSGVRNSTVILKRDALIQGLGEQIEVGNFVEDG
jgi:Cys-tRNA(Pro) deacylase